MQLQTIIMIVVLMFDPSCVHISAACSLIDHVHTSLSRTYIQEHQRIGGMLPGNILVRGLSGGEKRRLSLCCGTITDPRVLFADEPTSGTYERTEQRINGICLEPYLHFHVCLHFMKGLDSLAALMIVDLLRDACDNGMMVICTM